MEREILVSVLVIHITTTNLQMVLSRTNDKAASAGRGSQPDGQLRPRIQPKEQHEAGA